MRAPRGLPAPFGAVVLLLGTAAAHAGDAWDWSAAVPAGHQQVSVGDINATTDQSRFTYNWSATPAAPGDAAPALPTVKGEAAAIANLATVETAIPTNANVSQFAFGGIAGSSGRPGSATFMQNLSDGLFATGSVNATAKADEVTNARVDLSATAAGNVHSLTVSPPEGSTTASTFSVLQVSKMNSNAAAFATGTTVNGTVFRGDAGSTISSLKASAYGNVSTITLNKPGTP